MKFFTLIMTAICLFSLEASATPITDIFNEEPQVAGEVVVERPVDLNASYKDRRTTHGALFAITKEKFYPVDYSSLYDNKSIEDANFLGGESVDLIGAQLGYKYNFSLGSLGFLVGYSQGHSEHKGARNIWLKRTSASINYAIDNYFSEPWVVPYVEGGVYAMDIEEGYSGGFAGDVKHKKKDDAFLSESTSPAFSYKLGLLFQLDWLENAMGSSTQVDGLRSTGLQNTFLDVYFIDHLSASDAKGSDKEYTDGKPDLRSGSELGLGLKMEF